VREAASEDETCWARGGLRRQPALQRRIKAGSSLIDAYDAARSGLKVEARQKARQALSGDRKVALRGLAVLVWPDAAVRVRDRLNR
jgi:hypothetical protein